MRNIPVPIIEGFDSIQIRSSNHNVKEQRTARLEERQEKLESLNNVKYVSKVEKKEAPLLIDFTPTVNKKVVISSYKSNQFVSIYNSPRTEKAAALEGQSKNVFYSSADRPLPHQSNYFTSPTYSTTKYEQTGAASYFVQRGTVPNYSSMHHIENENDYSGEGGSNRGSLTRHYTPNEGY